MSSWISRLALSQGAELSDVVRFLGLKMGQDIDVQATSQAIRAIRDTCGLGEDAFYIADRVMTNLAQVPNSGYLASTGRRARFRYCPLCLREMHVSHYPIHWRFIAWRACPLHACIMEDHCPECKSAIAMPTNLYWAGPNKQGVGTLDRCLNCAKKLTSIAPVFLTGSHTGDFTEWDLRLIANGRALLAALYRGNFRVHGDARKYSVAAVERIRRHGGIPFKLSWLSPDERRASSP